MFKIKKLEELKKQIIDKLVTEKSVEEIKNKKMLRGGFFKQFFKYVFLKPMFFGKRNSKVDESFTDGEDLNYYKFIFLMAFLAVSFVGVAGSLLLKSIDPILVSSAGFLTLISFFMITFGAEWANENSKTKKKFDVKNIENIRKDLLENYSDYQVKYLLQEKLNKEELIHIMVELEKLTGKDEILINFEEIRKMNSCEGIFDDISQPYVLVKLIDKIISNDNKKGKNSNDNEKNSNKKEIKEFNNTIIDSLINNDNKNNSDEIKNCNKEKHILTVKI